MRKRISWLVSLLVLTGLVALAARTVDWGEALRAASSAHPLLVMGAMVLNTGILVLTAAQWVVFLPSGLRVPPRRMFEAVAITSLFSNSAPPGAGHVATVHYVPSRGGVSHSVGLSILFLDQLAEGVAKLTLIGAALLWVPVGLEFRIVAATLLTVVPALALSLIVLAHRGDFLERRAAQATGWLAAPLRLAGTIAKNLEALRHPRVFGQGVLLSWAQKLCEGLAIGLIVASLGIEIPVWGVLGLLVAVTLSTTIPLMPANLGVYEGAAFLVLRALGVEADAALGVALVMHMAYLVPMAGIGWLIVALRPLTGDAANDGSGGSKLP